MWDLASRFERDVVEDFVAEYAAGRTPNPCLRCNERIKFAGAARQGGGAGLRRRGDRALRAGRRGGRRPPRAAPGGRRGQGPVATCSACSTPTSSPARSSPSGDSTKPRGARGGRGARASAVARKPDSHDICFIPDGDTRALADPPAGGARPASSSTRRRGGRRHPRRGPRVHRRPAARARLSTGRRSTASRATSSRSTPRRNRVVIGTADLLGVDARRGRPRCGGAARLPTGEVRVGAQVRAHGAEVPATAPGDDADGTPCGCVARRAGPRGRAGPVGRALRGHPGRRLGDDQRLPPRAHPSNSTRRLIRSLMHPAASVCGSVGGWCCRGDTDRRLIGSLIRVGVGGISRRISRRLVLSGGH